MPLRFMLTLMLFFSGMNLARSNADSAETLPPDLVVRIELKRDSVKLGEPLVGKVVFTNNLPIEMKLFYPGFRNEKSISTFGATVDGVLPNGKPRIICRALHDAAETKCEVVELKLGPAIGGKLDATDLLVQIETEELTEEKISITEIPAGKEVSFDFRFDDCREAIPNFIEVDKNGRSKNEADPIVFGGTYELRFEYQAKSESSEKSWSGKISATPVRFDIQAVK